MNAIRKISSKLYDWSFRWSILLFIVFIVLYFVITDIFNDHVNDGKEILELTIYSSTEAYQIITSYGEIGRNSYFRHLFTDSFFGLLYSILFALILSSLIKRENPDINYNSLTQSNLIPFLIGILDVIENTCIGIMIKRFPDDLGFMPTLTMSITIIKMSVALCVVGLVIWKSLKLAIS